MTQSLGTLEVEIGADTTGLERANRRVSQVGGQMESTFSKLGGVIAAAISVESARRVLNLADKMLVLDVRLQMATKSSREYSKAQKELLRISNETGQTLSDSVALFEQLSIASAALGATNDEILVLTETVQKLGSLGGSSADEISNSLRQLGQGLAGGVLRAEEFNSILENTPMIAQELEKRMGFLPGTMRNAVNEGKVLSKDVFQALLEASDEVNKRFEKTPFTIAQAFNKLNNNFSVSIGLINKVSGSTGEISQHISDFADDIDKVILQGFADISGFVEEVKLNFGSILGDSQATSAELVIWSDVLGNLKAVLGSIMQAIVNLPINLKALFTVLIGEFDQLVTRGQAAFKLIFIEAQIQAREFVNSSAIQEVSGLFEKIFGIDFAGGNQQAITALNDRKVAIKELADAQISNSQSVIDQTLIETEKLKQLWSEQAEAKSESVNKQIEAARRGSAESKQVSTAVVSDSKNADDKALSNEQLFNQSMASLNQTSLGQSKRFAKAQAAFSFAVNVAKAAEKGFPQNIPFIAGAFAQGAMIKGLTSGGGRQFGGTTSGVLAHPVNESGNPEMLEMAGKQFLLPTGKGGKITPLGGSSSGGGGMPNITLINNGTPQTIESTRMSDDQIMVTIDDAVKSAKQEINTSLATGRGESAKSLKTGFRVEHKR
jgi:tape measure domain-containing protein